MHHLCILPIHLHMTDTERSPIVARSNCDSLAMRMTDHGTLIVAAYRVENRSLGGLLVNTTKRAWHGRTLARMLSANGHHSHRTTAGFTLVELLIALVIVAILAGTAIPSYYRYVVRSRQATATTQLTAVWQAQEIYRLQNGSYATNGTLLSGWLSTSKEYTFALTNPGGNSTFACTATGNIDGDATSDVWTIDQTGTLENTTNDLTN